MVEAPSDGGVSKLVEKVAITKNKLILIGKRFLSLQREIMIEYNSYAI